MSRSQTSVVVTSMTPGEQAGIDELLHRLPAGAGGVEDEAIEFLLQRAGDQLHARRGDAEHGEADGGLGLGATGLRAWRDHAGQRMGGVGEHLLGDAVDARDVGHRVHHADVGGADVILHIARGDGRDHHLGQADRQAPHGRRGQRGAAGAAGRITPPMSRARADEALEGLGHGSHGGAAIAAEDGRGALGMECAPPPPGRYRRARASGWC